MKKLLVRAGQKIRYYTRVGIFGNKQAKVKKRLSEEPLTKADSDSATQANSESGNGVGNNVGASPAEPKRTSARRQKPRWSIEQFEVVPKAGATRFHDFELPLSIMRGIASQNYQYCTPIQAKALPTVLAGSDLVGKANTGTGKSAVFLIAIFSRLLKENERRTKKGSPRALIIAPTRELVIQIAKDGKKLGQFSGLHIFAVYGGANYESQMQNLQRRTVDVVVATPGRLLDFANKNIIGFKDCRIMVIDEADRMLDMGFIPDVRRIIGRIPKKEKRQTLLFSATVSDDVKRLSYQWCVKPTYVEAEPEQVAVETVRQHVYLVTNEEKYSVLYNLIKQRAEDRIMVFANMKSEVRKLAERLQQNGIDCVLLSGDVPQNKREKRLESFRAGKTKVLVATDVAGRGIHIADISHVVNYTLPYEPEDYVHRIGRTGRAGAEGVSISFADEEGSFFLPEIEDYIGRSLTCEQPPENLLEPPPEPRKRRATKEQQHRRPPRKRSRRPARQKVNKSQTDK